jgi:hypothetical protein
VSASLDHALVAELGEHLTDGLGIQPGPGCDLLGGRRRATPDLDVHPGGPVGVERRREQLHDPLVELFGALAARAVRRARPAGRGTARSLAVELRAHVGGADLVAVVRPVARLRRCVVGDHVRLNQPLAG